MFGVWFVGAVVQWFKFRGWRLLFAIWRHVLGVYPSDFGLLLQGWLWPFASGSWRFRNGVWCMVVGGFTSLVSIHLTWVCASGVWSLRRRGEEVSRRSRPWCLSIWLWPFASGIGCLGFGVGGLGLVFGVWLLGAGVQ